MDKNVDYSNCISEELESAKQFYNTEFKMLADKDKDTVCSINSQGDILYCNPAAKKMFEYSKEEILGKKIFYLLPQKFHTAVQRAIDFFLAGNTTPYFGLSTAISAVQKNGTEFPIEITVHRWDVKDKTFFSIIMRKLPTNTKANHLSSS